MLCGDGGPTSAEVAQRAAEHERQLALDPPSHLGPDEPPPPVHVFPAPIRRATKAVLALVDAMQGDTPIAGTAPNARGLTGFGVGDATYTGRACVISGPDDDFGAIEAGDVLIAPFTSPSFNSVFPLLGAVAVEEGGPMSHTAIVSREFDIPAVVGVDGLLGAIRTGDVVTVDATAGSVVVAPTG